MKNSKRTEARTLYEREWKRKKRQDPEFKLKAASTQRKYYASDPLKKEKAFAYNLKTRYGLTLEQYQQLFDNQNGCCSLCGKHQSALKMRLAVDHDHSSNFIRSLLCSYCNLRVIGRLRKDTVERIYEYLNRDHTGWVVPTKKRKRKKYKTGAVNVVLRNTESSDQVCK